MSLQKKDKLYWMLLIVGRQVNWSERRDSEIYKNERTGLMESEWLIFDRSTDENWRAADDWKTVSNTGNDWWVSREVSGWLLKQISRDEWQLGQVLMEGRWVADGKTGERTDERKRWWAARSVTDGLSRESVCWKEGRENSKNRESARENSNFWQNWLF